MSKENIKRYTVMKVLNVHFVLFVLSAVVLNLLTLHFSNNNIEHWDFTINTSTLLFLISCILLIIVKKIKQKIVDVFISEYVKKQNAEIVKEKAEEYLMKIDDKLFNVNVRFNKKGIFVLKQRASTAAEIEAHLFDGSNKELKTSKYNNIWQTIGLNEENEIVIE